MGWLGAIITLALKFLQSTHRYTMVKKNTSGIALYKEDLKQSIEELTDLQKKMLSLTISDLVPVQRRPPTRLSIPRRVISTSGSSGMNPQN